MAVTVDDRLDIRLDIHVVKGRTFKRRYHAQYYSGDTLQDFSWDDYSGATMQVRRKSNSPIVELSFSTDDGSITLLSDGRFELNLDYDTMDNIRSGEYYYDLYLLGTIYPKRAFIFGQFIIESKITI